MAWTWCQACGNHSNPFQTMKGTAWAQLFLLLTMMRFSVIVIDEVIVAQRLIVRGSPRSKCRTVLKMFPALILKQIFRHLPWRSKKRFDERRKRRIACCSSWYTLLPIAGPAHHSAASAKIDKFSLILPILFNAISFKVDRSCRICRSQLDNIS